MLHVILYQNWVISTEMLVLNGVVCPGLRLTMVIFLGPIDSFEPKGTVEVKVAP